MAAQIEVVGGQIVSRSGGRTGGLGGLQRGFDDPGNARRHFVLKLEDIVERAVEPVGPQMRTGRGIDQLSRNAHATPRLADGALKHIADAQFAPDLLHVGRLAFVRETRILGDDEEPANAAQRGDDLVDHAVGEILLLGVAGDIDKRQHCDRRLVGEGRAGRLGSPYPRATRTSLPRKRGRVGEGAFRSDAEGPDGPRDIL